jgi:hypothetical protein
MLWGTPTHSGVNSHGKRVRWSDDLTAYEPGCARHNALLDHGGTVTTCKRGHDRAAWGTTRKSECRGCKTERNRARRERQQEDA